MFKFFFKKNFCDVWDNMYHVFLVNLIYLAVMVGLYFLGSLVFKIDSESSIGNLSIAFFLYIIVASIILSIFVFAEGENAASVANFDTPRMSSFFKNIPSVLLDGLLFGLMVGFLINVSIISIPYYHSIWRPEDGSEGSFMGLLLMAVVFWFLIIFALALQWFIPIRFLMKNSFGKCLKKSLIIFFDNPLFTIGVAFVNFLNLILTVVTFGLMPSWSGILITNTNALRLRLYKYDWLEVNPDLSPKEMKDVPWDELLAKDKKILGPRKIKSFIMPWKEDR